MKQEEINAYLQKVSEATGESVEDLNSKSKQLELMFVRKAICVSLGNEYTIRQMAKILNRSLASVYGMLLSGTELLMLEDGCFLRVYNQVKDIKY